MSENFATCPVQRHIFDGLNLSRATFFGLTGVGFNKSSQKLYYLPEAHTDFIFAIGAEELGLVFSLVLLALYVTFFVCGIIIAARSPDRLGRLLAYGMSFLLFFQVLFNIGVGFILSAMYVFFRDIQYLWTVFTRLLMYMSAIFYRVDRFEPAAQNLFYINPIYVFIYYWRSVVINGVVPSLSIHLLILADVAVVFGIGSWMYKKFNTEFLYYL